VLDYNNALQHTATNCNTLQQTATHTATPCNTRQHTATYYSALQHTATHCNTLQHTTTHYSTLQHTATHCNTLQHTAAHCNTLQHTATHCNSRNICQAIVSRNSVTLLLWSSYLLYISCPHHNCCYFLQYLSCLPYLCTRFNPKTKITKHDALRGRVGPLCNGFSNEGSQNLERATVGHMLQSQNQNHKHDKPRGQVAPLSL